MDHSRSISLLTIGHHTWKSPPEADSLNYPVAKGLARRLGGTHELIVAGGEGRRIAVIDDRVAVTYLRARAWIPFMLTALWVGARIARGIRGPAAILASDAIGAAVGVVLSAICGLPLIVQIQGEVLSPGREYGRSPKRWLLARVLRSAVRRAQGIRTVNRQLETEVIALRPHGIVQTIGSRVDTSVFTKGARYSETGRDGVIACVAALTVGKNQTVLIHALSIVQQRHPDAILRLVGDGPQRGALQRLAAELGVEHSVHFEGALPHGQVARVLREVDVFAFPSTSEGQPRAVLEAQSVGLPVVASRIPGVEAVVDHQRTGVLVEASDVGGWAAAVSNLLDDAALRRRLGTQSSDYVRKYHDFETSLDDFAKFIVTVAVAPTRIRRRAEDRPRP